MNRLFLSLVLAIPFLAQPCSFVRGEDAVAAAPSEATVSTTTIAFRAKDWVTKHFHSDDEAVETEKVLKQLGCEIKKSQHNGHIDVQFRTSIWKSLALENREQVQQWQTWLNAAGIEAIHGHKASDGQASEESHNEVVKYRLAEPKSLHLHNATQLTEFTTIYRALGCQTERTTHGDHGDLRLTCPEWMEVVLPSHDVAHKWMDFLSQAGFEVQHSH